MGQWGEVVRCRGGFVFGGDWVLCGVGLVIFFFFSFAYMIKGGGVFDVVGEIVDEAGVGCLFVFIFWGHKGFVLLCWGELGCWGVVGMYGGGGFVWDVAGGSLVFFVNFFVGLLGQNPKGKERGKR